MEKFQGQNIIEFTKQFPDDDSCKSYLADIKWKNGFNCKCCGHTRYSIKGSYTRVCTKCTHIESPTANTLFHKVKFGLQKAFMIVFEMTATTKGLSASQVAKRYGITRKTAWLFMHKVRTGMKSSEQLPMKGKVHVDEFVIGGQEDMKPGRSHDVKKKKVVCAVELTTKDKIKRVYAMRIDDYSAKSLNKIFDSHICTSADVTTDKWAGYIPLGTKYNITQKLSSNGLNFKQMHHVIHQIKSWLRTNYSWVHKYHTDKYLDEYAFRINRSQTKQNIFHRLIDKMMKHQHVGYKDIKVCI